jgi:hypothetical protein
MGKKITGYVAVAVVFLTAWLLMGASCSFSTANVKNALMTTEIDENTQPVDNVTSFSLGSFVYLSAELHNAPDDTTITVVWYYEGDELDRISFDNEGLTDTMIMSYMPPEMVTQTGDYSVAVFIDDRDKPDAAVDFTVTE